MKNILIIDILFVIRLIPLMLAGFISTKKKDHLGFIICMLYICVTSINYLFGDPSLNAIFSTPLVFITAWYIIKPNFGSKIQINEENIQIQNIEKQTVKNQIKEK